MPHYTITGLPADGKECQISFFADDEKAAIKKARENGVFATSMQLTKQAKGNVSSRAFHSLDGDDTERPGVSSYFVASLVCFVFGTLGLFSILVLHESTNDPTKVQNRFFAFVIAILTLILASVFKYIDNKSKP